MWRGKKGVALLQMLLGGIGKLIQSARGGGKGGLRVLSGTTSQRLRVFIKPTVTRGEKKTCHVAGKSEQNYRVASLILQKVTPNRSVV